MFGLFKKKTPKPEFSEIRELLFADVPLSDWKPRDATPDAAGPWNDFEAARLALGRGDTVSAVAALRRVVEVADVETRQSLQAWHCLRQLGVKPELNQGKRVLGVVLEVHLDDGLDTLAAYEDGSARYINHGGRAIVWEAKDERVSSLIASLLGEGQRVADVIGPWEEPRRPAPPRRHVRINMLTPSGLHFGEGPLSVLSADPMGGPVITAGTVLMQALIERAERTTA